jgi:hypothetical protein
VAGPSKEITEFTIGYTNIGGIEVSVYNPSNFLLVIFLNFSKFIRHKHQIWRACMMIQMNSFFDS